MFSPPLEAIHFGSVSNQRSKRMNMQEQTAQSVQPAIQATTPTAPKLPLHVKDNQVFASSLEVAKVFERRHDHVMRDIRKLKIPNDFRLPNFEEGTYIDKNGDKQPMFDMTRDGFTILAMGFTGRRAMAFKIAYIEAFNKMEAELRQQEGALSPKETWKLLTYNQTLLEELARVRRAHEETAADLEVQYASQAQRIPLVRRNFSSHQTKGLEILVRLVLMDQPILVGDDVVAVLRASGKVSRRCGIVRALKQLGLGDKQMKTLSIHHLAMLFGTSKTVIRRVFGCDNDKKHITLINGIGILMLRKGCLLLHDWIWQVCARDLTELAHRRTPSLTMLPFNDIYPDVLFAEMDQQDMRGQA
ncbi:MAG: Rha family transcriptional regulator [Magnetococcales bacterium]|nr:Rha family transcriptional regulator [Magnetococcales bacterium]